jgi:uncharacterized protein YdaU (DUF1376 family)
MPLFVADFLQDTSHLSTLESGAYLLLLMGAWTRGAELPDDDMTLARLARLSSAKWRSIRGTLAPFFLIGNGKWIQKRLASEYAHACEVSAKRQAIGSAGGRKSAAKRQAIGQAIGVATVQQTAKQTSKQNPTPPPPPLQPPTVSSKPSGEKTEARVRAKPPSPTPLPADFAISDRVKAWAEEKGHDRLQERFEWFVSYVRASGKRYVDWDDAFMNSVRGNWAKLPERTSARGSRLSAVGQQTAANLAAWKRREEERDAEGS